MRHTISLDGKLYHKSQVVKSKINLQDSKTITRGPGGKFAGKGGGVEEIVPKNSPTKQKKRESSVIHLSDDSSPSSHSPSPSTSPTPKQRSPRKQIDPKQRFPNIWSSSEKKPMDQEPMQKQSIEQTQETSQSANETSRIVNETTEQQEVGEPTDIERENRENSSGEGEEEKEKEFGEIFESQRQVKPKSTLKLRKSDKLKSAKPIDKFGAVLYR